MGDVEYFFINHDKEVWRTISVVSIDGEPHAYQQKRKLARPKYKNSRGRGKTFSVILVETNEHRFVPVRETVSEENAEKLVEGFKS